VYHFQAFRTPTATMYHNLNKALENDLKTHDKAIEINPLIHILGTTKEILHLT
jgi:hypothetical protein